MDIYVAELCRFLVLLVLVSAAYTKSRDFRSFATALVDEYRVPRPLGSVAASCVVGGEWLAALCLLLGGELQRPGIALALLMFVVFTAVLLTALVGGKAAYCHCFGRAARKVSGYDVARNGIYIAACAVVFLEASPVPATGLAAQLSLALAGLVLFVMSVGMREIASLLRG